MKRNYLNRSKLLSIGKAVLGLSLLMPFCASSQNTYTFTNCSATGATGPTQAQINSAYALTNLAGLVTATTQGIQQFTVNQTGPYRIEAYGAQGGPNWGLGAKMSGDFNLVAGQVLRIVVGQSGGSQDNSHGSGGGGSFVILVGNATPLMVAGGGGGKGASSNAVQNTAAGTTVTGGQSPGGGGPGGTGGGGGAAASGATGGTSLTPGAGAGGSTWASGGGGYYTDGGNYNSGNSFGGRAFLNNALGGDAATGAQTQGGFGGGGGAGDRGAGGGGYSGGGGATNNSDDGGGGGSYNAGANQINAIGVRSGMGQVLITPLCNVGISGLNTICIGQSATLTTSAASNINWSGGNGNGQTVILTPQATTGYTLTGNGTIPANCAATIVFSVYVNPLPVITTSVTPGLLCVGSTATIEAFGASTYTWNAGPTGTNTMANPIVSTSYNVVGTNSNGCVSSAAYMVNVNTLSLSISGANTVCKGKSTVLTGSGGTSLAWAGLGPFNPITTSPESATVYTLTGIDANGCTLTQTVEVDVNPVPVVTASASKTLICKGASVNLTAGGATTYTWTGGLGNNAAVSVTPALNTMYNYSVTGTDANGCTNGADVNIDVRLCTGINEVSANTLHVNIYPNPSNGIFTVELNNSLSKTIEVIDVTGRTILSNTSANALTDINISNLSNGVYYIKVTSVDGSAIQKVVKQ